VLAFSAARGRADRASSGLPAGFVATADSAKFSAVFAASLAAALTSGAVSAQAPAEQHLNESVPNRPAYITPTPSGSFVLPSPGAAEAAPIDRPFAPAPTRTIARVIFRGNTVVATAELDAIAAPYLNRPVTSNEIEDLRVKLTRRYVDAGYINSGALIIATPDSPDALVFEIVEGRLESIQTTGSGGLAPHYITSRLSTGDGVLNVDALRERFQLLLSDPLIEQMNARLVPGSAQGLAELDVDVTRAAPYTLSTYFNNYRPPSIGAEGVGIMGIAHNLTGQGDELDINEEAPIEGGSALSSSVHWTMPLYYPGTDLLLQYDRGASAVTEEPLNVLGIQSTLETVAVGLSQVVFETLRQNVTLSLLHEWRSNRTSLLDQGFSFTPGEPAGTVSAPLWRFVQDYSYRTERDVFALRSTISAVSTNLQPIPGLPTPIEPQRNYDLWLLQAQYARQTSFDDAQLVLRATIQATQSHVLPIDQMAIGGDSTVRGYRENQLLVDNGQVYNIEYDMPVYTDSARHLAASLGPFYDYGRGRDEGSSYQSLSALGVAAQVHWYGAEFDISKAARLVYPHDLVTGRGNLQDRGVYFQLRYTVSLR
jgi:hemolysin activation/secretion protein